MKKFIVSVLCVAVFFMGLGSLVERAGAKFKSDAKSLELIGKARIAIGGDEAIRAVRSLSIKGKTTVSFEVNGTTRTEQGETELALQLPNLLMKKMKIGNHDAAGHPQIIEESDVVIVKKGEGEPTVSSVPGEKKVAVRVENATEGGGKVTVTKSDGTTEEVNLEKGSQEIVTKDGTKVIVKKVDGANGSFVFDGNQKPGDTQEITTPDGKKVFVRKVGEGNATFTTQDGKKIVVDKDVRIERAGGHQNELLRLTLSLLLSSPEGIDVSYTYAGEENVGGISCNAINAEFGGETYKLFLDKSSNLPVAMNYRGTKMHKVIKIENGKVNGENAVIHERKIENGKKEVHIFANKMPAPESADFQVRFSDFRSVGGVQFPHRWETSVAGKTEETFEATSFEVNSANINEILKAQPRRVMMKVAKPTK